jgi:hypothetical protein
VYVCAPVCFPNSKVTKAINDFKVRNKNKVASEELETGRIFTARSSEKFVHFN